MSSGKDEALCEIVAPERRSPSPESAMEISSSVLRDAEADTPFYVP
jgi:hypothetical protein